MEWNVDQRSIDSTYDLDEELSPTRNGLWTRYFPHGFWYEWKCLAMLALPIMLTSVSNYAVVPVSLFFLGRLGKTELAAGGLAISIFHVAGVSIIFGLLTASETLFPQFCIDVIFFSDSFIGGSAISQSLGYMAQASVVVVYILVSRIYRTTWDGEFSCRLPHFEMW
eukprot:TsM_000456600 transcript=TsM_000456600 gene=TsM_000456600